MVQETGMYYLQSRYYDPEICRFINADSFASTGQGILGYNMFAYCLNNPANRSDPKGTIPFYDDPMQKFYADFWQWYRETDENETDENGESTLAAKIKKTITSLARSVEFSAGFGVGLGEELRIIDVGESIYASCDIIAIQYYDGKWSFGQRISGSLSASLTKAFEIGVGGFDTFREFNGSSNFDGWLLYNNKKESWSLFSISWYPYFLGANFDIGININEFLHAHRIIWEE